MKIVAFSDTHGLHKEIFIPQCDLLLFAGDWSNTGNILDLINFSSWLDKQPAKEKIIIW